MDPKLMELITQLQGSGMFQIPQAGGMFPIPQPGAMGGMFSIKPPPRQLPTGFARPNMQAEPMMRRGPAGSNARGFMAGHMANQRAGAQGRKPIMGRPMNRSAVRARNAEEAQRPRPNLTVAQALRG